jgi:replication factor C large subunit
MTYTEKYRPNKLCDVVGNQHHVKYLVEWAEAWESGFNIEKKAVILYGNAGIGKTSAAHALATEMTWDVIELNASDQRTAGIINRIARSASKTGTFDGIGGRKLIVLDEADNLHGGRDRGGSKAISNLIKTTAQPIIIIANDFYKLDTTLKSLCASLKFNNVDTKAIKTLLKDICEKENITIDNKVLEQLAKNCNGDVRAATNDLESICVGKDHISIDDITNTKSDDNKRNISETIFTFVDKVFKSNDIKKILESSSNINENPETTIHWFDENIPLIYKDTDELHEAYDLLSKADIFLGRVHKRQNYTLWKYANTLICGVGSIGKVRSGFVKYSPPKYWSKLKNSKSDRYIKKSIANKVGKLCHISTKKVLSDILWFIKELMKNGEYSIIISYELGLNKDEIAYLFNTKVNSERVKTVYDLVQELKEDDVEIDDINTDDLIIDIKNNVTEDSDKKVKTKPLDKPQMSLGDF